MDIESFMSFSRKSGSGVHEATPWMAESNHRERIVTPEIPGAP
jgi:hypothetical protein